VKGKTCLVIGSCLIVLFLNVAGCGGKDKPDAPAKVQSINIVTGTTGSAYYPLGKAMAKLFDRKIPNVKTVAVATAGTAQNIFMMQKKETEIAFAHNGVAYYAYNGKAMFQEKPANFLRGITNLYPNVVHIMVAENSNITSIKDFRGKTFVPGVVGSATEINLTEILNLHGINYKEDKEGKSKFVDYPEAAAALKEGLVDGIIIAGGLPIPSIQNSASLQQIRILSIETDMIVKMKETMPWYSEITIPKGTYKGQTEEVKTIVAANLLVCRDDLSTDLVYNMTKALHENREELIATNSLAKDMTLQDALKGMTVPLHPGAEKYYREKGIIK